MREAVRKAILGLPIYVIMTTASLVRLIFTAATVVFLLLVGTCGFRFVLKAFFSWYESLDTQIQYFSAFIVASFTLLIVRIYSLPSKFDMIEQKFNQILMRLEELRSEL